MIVNLKNETNLSGFYIIYKGSTSLETKGNQGASHFWEHIKCRCIDDLMNEFQENSIIWNAYTSDNEIVFHFTGLEEYLAPYRDIIIDRFYRPITDFISEEIFEKERQIILEEYNDYFSNPEYIFTLNMFRNKFNHYSAIGLKEDIETLTYEDLLKFNDIQYDYPDLIVNISKDFKYEKDLQFTHRTIFKELKENIDAPIEPLNTSNNNLYMVYYQKIDREDVPYMTIINKILGDGLNSPLYQEIREKKALCYGISASVDNICNNFFLSINLSSTKKKETIIDKTLNELFLNKELHFTEERWNIIKKSMNIKLKKNIINRHTYINDIISEEANKVNKILNEVTFGELKTYFEKYYNFNMFTKVANI